jgi:tetratricopeptide (TPR) repeat protein
MMNEIRVKYIFYFSAAILLILMMFLSRNAGISCDEVLHYDHSVSVYNYYASHGHDMSALNTPVTNLKYYGQSYDNIVTILIRWFGIDDAYGFRHLMSAFAGWVAVFITALFAVWLMDYKTGIIVLILFAVSPTFMGHAQNNLKDIPFALAYISSIYFTFKLLVPGRKYSARDILLLTASIAFSISIRAGGLILICYLFFFLTVFYAFRYLVEKKIDFAEAGRKLLLITGISVVSWFMSIILWPFALNSPVKNVIESYNIMAHFPSTFRQIFEGRVEWSDYMPWYYIPKSMMITIPLAVMAGIIFFIIFSMRKSDSQKRLLLGSLIFTIVFPLVFVIYEKSNVYSSWRQFLFLYPAIVLLAAAGYSYLFSSLQKWYFKAGLGIVILLLSFHPLKYMISNPSFYYMYYNQLAGGINGAYARYETDYYYVSQTEASEWLIDYLKNKNSSDKVKVMATYPVDWQFRNHPEIKTFYQRNEERSMNDWDYAIVTNRYITPFQLRNKIWPPSNSIHIIYADNVPVCSVLERRTKDDYLGYVALKEGKNAEALDHFKKACQIDDSDEMIFYNFAAAFYNTGQFERADSLLRKGLELNPDFEPALMYQGNISRSAGRKDEAISYYEKLIKVNRKYFEAYVAEAELLTEKDVLQSRRLLAACLNMNPKYKPAILALAETFKISNPEIAKKYLDWAEKIK